MEEFLKYWEDVLDYWVKNGSVHPSETHWFKQQINLLPELMPEPYLGDPHNCSVVIMNYNPGAADYDLNTDEGRNKYRNDAVHHSRLDNPKSMCYHYARNYRERVAAGGYLGKGVDLMYETSGLTESGKKWWNRRLNWFKRLVPDSNKLPFAIELCGWHSNKWGAVNFKDENLLRTLKELLAPVIEEAIKNSDLGIGLCVGKLWGTIILPYFGYTDVTAEVLGLDNYNGDYKPLSNSQRNYRILRNVNGTHIINTWLTSGFGMCNPGKRFCEKEREMIRKINESSSLLDTVLSSSADEVNRMSAGFFASGMFKPNK